MYGRLARDPRTETQKLIALRASFARQCPRRMTLWMAAFSTTRSIGCSGREDRKITRCLPQLRLLVAETVLHEAEGTAARCVESIRRWYSRVSTSGQATSVFRSF